MSQRSHSTMESPTQIGRDNKFKMNGTNEGNEWNEWNEWNE